MPWSLLSPRGLLATIRCLKKSVGFKACQDKHAGPKPFPAKYPQPSAWPESACPSYERIFKECTQIAVPRKFDSYVSKKLFEDELHEGFLVFLLDRIYQRIEIALRVFGNVEYWIAAIKEGLVEQEPGHPLVSVFKRVNHIETEVQHRGQLHRI